jgi:hypothetical protein
MELCWRNVGLIIQEGKKVKENGLDGKETQFSVDQQLITGK